MNLQASYDLRRARATEWPKLERRVRVLAAE
jgi:antitoxin HigA-1